MKIFCTLPTVNLSKLNLWLLICIGKDFIWTTLKSIFSIFRPSDSRFSNSCISAKYCPILTNHTVQKNFFFKNINGNLIYSASRWYITLRFFFIIEIYISSGSWKIKEMLKMCPPTRHPRLGWVCFFFRFGEMCHSITCSAMDALQWMGAVRMRVQTADKNITIIHK